jgi:hypothetical protein
MGNSIHETSQQIQYIQLRLRMFGEVLEQLEAEQIEPEDVERLVKMIEDIEKKLMVFQTTKSSDTNNPT